ncbi:MAG TPA: hypothetical protein VFZ42_07375, partial [Chitinophagaceae bacterium]
MSLNKYDRRSFLTKSIKTFGAAELAIIGLGVSSVGSKSIYTQDYGKAIKSYDQLKQIEAGDLNVGYVDAGIADGPVVILLHGWPYD